MSSQELSEYIKEVSLENPVVDIEDAYETPDKAGDLVKNQENARTYCRFAVEAGCVPIAPHIYFTQFMNDNDRKERDLALFMDIVLLSKCAELWVFGEKITSGMSIEVEKAKRKGQLIRYFTETCEEVRR